MYEMYCITSVKWLSLYLFQSQCTQSCNIHWTASVQWVYFVCQTFDKRGMTIGQWFAGVPHETEESLPSGLNVEDSAVVIEGSTIHISHYHVSFQFQRSDNMKSIQTS